MTSIQRGEWIPDLLRCASLLRRLALRKATSRPPLLSQILRLWRRVAKDRWPEWQCDLLFGHAVADGVFTVTAVQVQRSVAVVTEVGNIASSHQWALAAVVHASGHQIAQSSQAALA